YSLPLQSAVQIEYPSERSGTVEGGLATTRERHLATRVQRRPHAGAAGPAAGPGPPAARCGAPRRARAGAPTAARPEYGAPASGAAATGRRSWARGRAPAQ